MNSALPDDNELDEDEDVYGVAERLRSIREGKREAHFNWDRSLVGTRVTV